MLPAPHLGWRRFRHPARSGSRYPPEPGRPRRTERDARRPGSARTQPCRCRAPCAHAPRSRRGHRSRRGCERPRPRASRRIPDPRRWRPKRRPRSRHRRSGAWCKSGYIRVNNIGPHAAGGGRGARARSRHRASHRKSRAPRPGPTAERLPPGSVAPTRATMAVVPEWRNRQTRRSQTPLAARLYEFKSRLRHRNWRCSCGRGEFLPDGRGRVTWRGFEWRRPDEADTLTRPWSERVPLDTPRQGGYAMPKYLFTGSFTAQGARESNPRVERGGSRPSRRGSPPSVARSSRTTSPSAVTTTSSSATCRTTPRRPPSPSARRRPGPFTRGRSCS